jgi:hypothetical protein
MGAADLIANGKQVAIIDYHNGDAYTNAAGLARQTYYNLQGSPTAWFDGGNAVEGGSHTVSMYPQYLAKYNQRINILSSFTVDIEGSNSGMIDYELNITVDKVASSTATNMVLHVVVTESNIQQNWQGMTELNHVERLMVPNQSGTPLDFSGGNTIEVTTNFTMNPSWVIENCEVVVFIQNLQNKEILQASMSSLTEFGTTNTNDASILNVVAPHSVCLESFTPKVKIANYGLDNLTSLDIIMNVNNGSPITQNWTGNLAFLESEIIVLPEITFTLQPSNTFTISCENPNGQPDQFPSNNTKVISMDDAMNVTSPVSLALKLDTHPDETTWELLNSQGEVLYSGGPYTVQNQFIVQSFNLDNADCYTFIIDDAGGDGLTGQGLYKLAHQGSTIFAEGKAFGFEDQVQFGIGLTGVNEMNTDQEFTVSPNPVRDVAAVSFDVISNSSVQLRVYNSTGEMVYESMEKNFSIGDHTIIFENKNLNAGIYYFHLSIGENLMTRKVVITK